MPGETDLDILLKTMHPRLNAGEYVFCTVAEPTPVNPQDILMTFREGEGITIILSKEKADALHWKFTSVFSWITLTVHSSLDAVGLTAAFSKALADNGISCNVVAAFYHDHIFVNTKDAEAAMQVLKGLSA